jgi:hypothetical protein
MQTSTLQSAGLVTAPNGLRVEFVKQPGPASPADPQLKELSMDQFDALIDTLSNVSGTVSTIFIVSFFVLLAAMLWMWRNAALGEHKRQEAEEMAGRR